MARTIDRPLRVLITNDDGPPTSKEGPSPFIYPLAKLLKRKYGWDVRVVVPSSQRSWVGKCYLIADTITGRYFYPRGEDGSDGEFSDLPRPLDSSKGEDMEWILLDGTPATCSNVALHSLFPPGTFDLVIAGPNFGRNTSSAFALSSGTLGSAMAASMSGVPSVALSFGLMTGYKPPSEAIISGALEASVAVIKRLYEVAFDDPEGPDIYSINVPLLPNLAGPEPPEVHWTTMAKTRYDRLFKPVRTSQQKQAIQEHPVTGDADATAEAQAQNEKLSVAATVKVHDDHLVRPLEFVFAPDITSLVDPGKTLYGTDAHAVQTGCISVNPLRAAFETTPFPASIPTADGTKWKL